MPKDLSQIKVGNYIAYFKGVQVGHTKGGVTFSYTQELEDVSVDQYGTTPVDKILAGTDLRIKVPLAQYSNDNLQIAMPAAQEESGGEGTRVELGAIAGTKLGQFAGELRLHPELITDLDDKSEDIVIYKAVSIGKTELNLKYNEQQVIEVEFQALPDETKSVGNRLGHIGVDSIS